LLAAEQTTTASFRQTEPPKLVHLVRGDLDWIVMKCLEKDRARRYETANALAMDLQRHLNSEPVLARPPSRFYEFQKTVRRHKVGFAAAALVMVALLLGLVGSLWQASRARRAEREQRYRAYVADMNLAQQALAQGDLGRARSLLQTYVPKRGERDLRNWEWRYLANECRGHELYSLAGHEDQVSNIRFLDKNTLITAGRVDFRTILWDLLNQRAATVIRNKNSGGGIGSLAIAPKQRKAYYRSSWPAAQQVWSFGLDGGMETPVAWLDDAVGALDLSAD
jgi:type II secretory pathway pseudopilin PulG